MKDIDLQIEEIDSARKELKKHFGEHYELSGLVNSVRFLEELKRLRKENEQLKKELSKPERMTNAESNAYWGIYG